jgi:hypothetical protein
VCLSLHNDTWELWPLHVPPIGLRFEVEVWPKDPGGSSPWVILASFARHGWAMAWEGPVGIICLPRPSFSLFTHKSKPFFASHAPLMRSMRMHGPKAICFLLLGLV